MEGNLFLNLKFTWCLIKYDYTFNHTLVCKELGSHLKAEITAGCCNQEQGNFLRLELEQ